jgi:hypothetical protein
MMRRLLLALFLALPLPAMAQTTALSADQQVLLLMKILTYDRQFEKKAGAGGIVIGIVYLEADAASRSAAQEIGTSFYNARTKTVKNLPIRKEMLAYTTADDLQKEIKAKGINMLYVTPGLAKQLPDLVRISQANRMTSTTGYTEYVDKGVAVGVGQERNKPQIVINLPASKSEGSEFDAQLLQMAKGPRK